MGNLNLNYNFTIYTKHFTLCLNHQIYTMLSIPENKIKENPLTSDMIKDSSSSAFLTPTSSNKHDGYCYNEKVINKIIDQSDTNTINTEKITVDDLTNISDEFKLPILLDEKENRDKECNHHSLTRKIYCSLKSTKETNKNKQQHLNQSNNIKKINRIVKRGKSSSILDLRLDFIELSSNSPEPSQCPSSSSKEIHAKATQKKSSKTTTPALNENHRFQTPKIGYSTIPNNNDENDNNHTDIIPLNKRKSNSNKHHRLISLDEINNNNIPTIRESTLSFNDNDLISNDLLLPKL